MWPFDFINKSLKAIQWRKGNFLSNGAETGYYIFLNEPQPLSPTKIKDNS